jgi:hypothetical protein
LCAEGRVGPRDRSGDGEFDLRLRRSDEGATRRSEWTSEQRSAN